MKRLFLVALISLLYTRCSKAPENNAIQEDYAKQILGKYKVKMTNNNGTIIYTPDSIPDYYCINYNSLNKVDILIDFSNTSGIYKNVSVDSNFNLTYTIADSKLEGTVRLDTLSFTMDMNVGIYMSVVAVK